MEERATRGTTSSARTSARRDVAAVLVLLLLAGGLRLWVLRHTEVAARDSIGFIHIAWQLEHKSAPEALHLAERRPERPPGWVRARLGWLQSQVGPLYENLMPGCVRARVETLHQAEQHPGYPLLILAMSLPVRHLVSGSDAVVMQLSAQLVSVLAGTLLVVPMFFLGRDLFNRTTGFWAAVLFQCFPASCRVLSDGLSEATFLLFAVTALLLALHALRRGSPFLFALCGLCGGLAYLTRPEGALIVAVTGGVLLGLQLFRAWRRPWRPVLRCGGNLAVAALLVGAPLVIATGRLSVKPTWHDAVNPIRSAAVEEGADEQVLREEQDRPGVMPAPALGRPLSGAVLGVWVQDPTWFRELARYPAVWGLVAVGHEIVKGSYYAAWVPALFGLVWFWGRTRREPGAWVALLVCLAIALLLWRVAAVMGYVSDRHTLLLLLCGSYWAVAGVTALSALLAVLLGAQAPDVFLRLRLRTLSGLVSLGLLLALIAPALYQARAPLHDNRGGFRAAGLWLAEHAQPADEILDPYCWTEYYAGRLFLKPPGTTPSGSPRIQYVVWDPRKQHLHLPKHLKARDLIARGAEVYHWCGRHGKHEEEVQIYAVPLR